MNPPMLYLKTLCLALAPILFMSCNGSPTMTDAGPDGGDTETGDPALTIEPELPLSECDVEFDKVYEIPGVYSARAWSVIELPSGHFVVVGEAEPQEQSTLWDRDGFLMEVDENGEMVWARLYGKEDDEDESNDMDTLASVFLFGNSYFAFGMTELNGEHGVWALETSLEGEVQLSKKLNVNGSGRSAYKMSETEVLLLAHTSEEANPLIVKYSIPDVLEVLNEETGWPEDLHLEVFVPGTSLEGYVRGGYQTIDVDGTNFTPNENWYHFPFISLFDSEHLKVWERTLDPGYSGTFTNAVETSDGNILAGGWLLYDDERWGSYFAKMDTLGNLLWHRLYGLNGGKGVSGIVTTEGGYVFVDEVGGYGVYDGYIARIDEEGNLKWHFVVDHTGENYFADLIATDDGGYLAVGCGNDWVDDGQGTRPWLVKIRSNEVCY